MARSPSATSRRCFPDTSATRPMLGMRATKAAEARNVAAFTAKAGPGPATATSAPATGASAIWEITAADQIAELAATTWSSGTRAGRTLAAAGLKKTLNPDRRKAARYTTASCSWNRTSPTATPARARSATSMTRRLG